MALEKLIDQQLTPVQEPGELEQSLGLKYDSSKDWDTARQALDSALFGGLTKNDPKLAKAKKAWEAEHGPAADRLRRTRINPSAAKMTTKDTPVVTVPSA